MQGGERLNVQKGMEERHLQVLMRAVFVVLVCVLVVVGMTTRARPRTRREWALVWAVLVLLAWALLGSAFLRSS